MRRTARPTDRVEDLISKNGNHALTHYSEDAAAEAARDVVGEDEEKLGDVGGLSGAERGSENLEAVREWALPPVPWSRKMALSMWPAASRCGVPRVR
jgi:hypothetical protein